jgi:RHS repeat-associated protein
VLLETNASGSLVDEYVFFGGKRIARRNFSSTVFYYFADHLGTSRVMVQAGQNTKCYDADYYPYGKERVWTNSCPQNYKFTGHERDSETNLDYMKARYYSPGYGRFVQPDEPFADQEEVDPQSWNLYTYVRNNPMAHVDPNGRACSALLGNIGSGFCQRAELYANVDTLVHKSTRFFAAASATSQALANVAVPGFGRVGTSAETRALLESTGQALQRFNTEIVGKIISGHITLSGPDLDAKLVHLEQNAVQKQLDSLKRSDPTAYGTAIKEINVLLNSKDGAGLASLVDLGKAIFPTDKAYAQVLEGVRKSLGRDIDFANQKDREAIGLALVKHVRATGGCDVAGDRAHGCGQ